MVSPHNRHIIGEISVCHLGYVMAVFSAWGTIPISAQNNIAVKSMKRHLGEKASSTLLMTRTRAPPLP